MSVPVRDSGADWERFDLAIIRSTWDYVDQRERFLEALSAIDASSCRLLNPLPAVRWSDKSYFFDLDEWGVHLHRWSFEPRASEEASLRRLSRTRDLRRVHRSRGTCRARPCGGGSDLLAPEGTGRLADATVARLEEKRRRNSRRQPG